MEQIICPIHNANILIYTKEEENFFIDDNKAETVIVMDKKGNKKLKRYIIGKCDETCETIKGLLE